MPSSSFSADAVVIGRGISHLFKSAQPASGDPDLIDGPKWNGLHVGSTEWDYVIRKSSNQSVTNSTTLVDDTQLQFNVFTDQVWQFELVIVYVSDTTGDYKFALAAPISVAWHRSVGSDTTANAIAVSTGVRTASTTVTASTSLGGSGSTSKKLIFIEGMFVASGNGLFRYQFAQNVQTNGQNATTQTGSLLKAARIF